MTTDDILRMAREAGFDFDAPTKYEHAALLNRAKHDLPAFERFAALVAAAEREACADILDRNCDKCDPHSIAYEVLDSNAKAIRARSQQ